MTFSEKIQRLRKLNNLSQEQLAEKLNVSRQAISKWEMGAMPDMDNVIKISSFFDCSLDYLLNNEVTDMINNTAERVPAEVNKKIKPEAICIVVGIISAILIASLWVMSKFIDVGIHRQNGSTGNWYTGFSGFIEHFGLYGLLFALVIILLFSITVRVCIQLFIHRKASSKRFFVFRLVSWLLYVLGIVLWLYFVLKPWTFLWSPITYIAVGVYCLLAIICSMATVHFERR